MYQITDRPEIRSAGRRWTLRPEEKEHRRIEQYRDPTITKDKGTIFRLPWAFEKSEVREKLGVLQVDRNDIDFYVDELKKSLPKAILFLRKLDRIELLRNGNPVIHVKRVRGENTTRIYYAGIGQSWRIMESNFRSEASRLKENNQFSGYIEDNRLDSVWVAIPDSLLDNGLLFATLPTEQPTGLPFHINADFFPKKDRKSIVFEYIRDPRSEWNRAAIRAAAVAVGGKLIALRDMFRADAPTFWGILGRLQQIHKDQDDPRIPLGAFWEKLSPSLPNSPVVYTESGKWVTPDQARIPTGNEEKEAVSAFGALGIKMVHRDLLKYRSFLRSIGVDVLRIEHIYGALQSMGMVGCTPSDNPLPADTLELLWKGIHGVLGNTGEAKQRATEGRLKQCALAPGLDERLWPCGLVYRADERTRKLFAPLMSRDAASFLAKRGMKVPLLKSLCPQFTPRSAISELERPEAQWHAGRFDPVDLLRWFDSRNRKTRLAEDLRERLTKLPAFPSEGGYRRPGSLVYRADAPTRRLFALLMGHDDAPFLAERVMDISLLGELCPLFTPGSAIDELECLEAQDLQTQWRAGSFNPAALLHWFDDHKLQLDQRLRERLAQLPIFPSAKHLRPLEDLRLRGGGFNDPIGVADLLDEGKLGSLRNFLESLGARELTFPDYARNYIPTAFTADSAVSRENKRKLLDILADGIGEIIFNQEIKGRLTAAHIVECSDGEFRQPGTVYLPNNEVKAVLGNHVNYALLPRKSERRADLYRRLGVEERPRVEDILEAIDKQVDRLPNQEAGKKIARILEAVGEAWARLDNVKLLRENLPTWEIIECTDGEFRRPTEIYFPNEEVKAILGDRVSYARLPEKSKGRASLYRQLGVKSRPHAKDILRAIDKLAARTLACQKTRKEMVNILETVGKDWAKLRPSEKERYSSLKNKAWLPAERDLSRWYTPKELYATDDKRLFASQAQFLDLPIRVQREIRKFLECLGVNRCPQPFHVVEHLLWCSERKQAPPGGVYQWLNNNAQPGDLEGLQRTTCIHIGGGEYRCPDEVFRGEHSFGGFRFELGDDFRQYPKLLSALDIKESLDHNDAIQVLKDISKEMGSNTLSSEDKDRDAVLQCWVMLSEALERKKITVESVERDFYNIRCVLNRQEVLEKPSLMFFSDNSVPLERFPDLSNLFSNNLIDRLDRVYRAMEAAGVSPISDVVRGIVDEPVNPQEDEKLKGIVERRTRLIEHVSNNAIKSENVSFIRVEELKVRWCTDVFNRNYSTPPEPISAHLDKDTLYFTSEGDDRPWRAIARELTKAIALGEEIGPNAAPAIMMILQAAIDEYAISHLKELGITIPEELGNLTSTGAVAESFGEVPPSGEGKELPTPPQDESTPGGVINETPQRERDKPAESGPMPLDDENDTPTGPSGGDSRPGGSTGHRAPTPLGGSGPTRRRQISHERDDTSSRRQPKRGSGDGGGPPFISHVGTHPDEKEPSPEGAERAARRLEIEESAIASILEREPEWECTPTHNPGYDLEKIDHNGVISLCEVKAMTGTWDDRPVTVSSTQFEMAQKCGEAYWLYVVENARTADARIVRIQDPAGKARTFTFDHGWLAVTDDDIDLAGQWIAPRARTR